MSLGTFPQDLSFYCIQFLYTQTYMVMNYTELRLKYNCFSFHRSENEASFSFDHPGYETAVD